METCPINPAYLLQTVHLNPFPCLGSVADLGSAQDLASAPELGAATVLDEESH